MSVFIRGLNYIGRKAYQLTNSVKYRFDDQKIIISYCDTKSCKHNFGDALNPFLVSYLSNKKVYSYRQLMIKPNEPVYSVIGSILDNQDIKNLEVWGSGFISAEGKFKTLPQKVHAVRGPLSREIVLKHGIDCPEVYGDPGLLLPLFFNSNKTKEYKLGVIPHFVDKDNPFMNQLLETYPNDVLLIDIESDFQKVIDDVNRCDHIISSSLHGLIVADAYGIPSLWVEFSDKVIGQGFKFKDYMLSVNKSQLDPIVINSMIDLNDLLSRFTFEPIQFDQQKLLNACPFLSQDKKVSI